MKTVFKSVLFFASTLVFSGAAISQVSSISSDSLVQYGKEDAYWVADVTCANDGKRIIQRKTDGDEWCGKAIPGFCDTSKEGTANKACGAQYATALSLAEETKQAEQAEKNAARTEALAKRAEREKAERAEQRRLADERIEQQRIEREKKAAAAAAEPLNEQINIEEELIRIEQEKLDLRRQELDLQRRAAEIDTLLKEAS